MDCGHTPPACGHPLYLRGGVSFAAAIHRYTIPNFAILRHYQIIVFDIC